MRQGIHAYYITIWGERIFLNVLESCMYGFMDLISINHIKCACHKENNKS